MRARAWKLVNGRGGAAKARSWQRLAAWMPHTYSGEENLDGASQMWPPSHAKRITTGVCIVLLLAQTMVFCSSE
jgi:hypothetical protein